MIAGRGYFPHHIFFNLQKPQCRLKKLLSLDPWTSQRDTQLWSGRIIVQVFETWRILGFWMTGHQRVLKSCIIYFWAFVHQVSMVMGSAGTDRRCWAYLVPGDVFLDSRLCGGGHPPGVTTHINGPQCGHPPVCCWLDSWFGQSHWLWGSQLLKIESMVLPPAH